VKLVRLVCFITKKPGTDIPTEVYGLQRE